MYDTRLRVHTIRGTQFGALILVQFLALYVCTAVWRTQCYVAELLTQNLCISNHVKSPWLNRSRRYKLAKLATILLFETTPIQRKHQNNFHNFFLLQISVFGTNIVILILSRPHRRTNWYCEGSSNTALSEFVPENKDICSVQWYFPALQRHTPSQDHTMRVIYTPNSQTPAHQFR